MRTLWITAALLAVLFLGPVPTFAEEITIDDFQIAPFSYTDNRTESGSDWTQSGLDPSHVIGGQRDGRIFSQLACCSSMELSGIPGEDGVVITAPVGSVRNEFIFHYGVNYGSSDWGQSYLHADLTGANAFQIDVTTMDTDWVFGFEGSDDLGHSWVLGHDLRLNITGSGTYLVYFNQLGAINPSMSAVSSILVRFRTPFDRLAPDHALEYTRTLTLHSIRAVTGPNPPPPPPPPPPHVPDPGSTLLLLGMGLAGVRACRRWRK